MCGKPLPQYKIQGIPLSPNWSPVHSFQKLEVCCFEIFNGHAFLCAKCNTINLKKATSFHYTPLDAPHFGLRLLVHTVPL